MPSIGDPVRDPARVAGVPSTRYPHTPPVTHAPMHPPGYHTDRTRAPHRLQCTPRQPHSGCGLFTRLLFCYTILGHPLTDRLAVYLAVHLPVLLAGLVIH